MLTQARLKELLHYDPETGLFTRLVSVKQGRAGDIAGSIDSRFYISISIDGKNYRAHRLAWLYMTGKFPKRHIDHKDTIRHHNWWDNLREATNQQNQFNRDKSSNNTSGFKGITWRKDRSRWYARGRLNGKTHYLGLFTDISDAVKAYDDFAKKHHGEFHREQTA